MASSLATVPRATYRLQLQPSFGFDDAARVADYLAALGMDRVRAHEVELVGYALAQLGAVEGVTIHGPPGADLRSGVVAFTGLRSTDLQRETLREALDLGRSGALRAVVDARPGAFALAAVDDDALSRVAALLAEVDDA